MSKRYNPLALAKKDREREVRSKYVRKKLIDIGMSQRELAAMVPMRYQYLNDILRGKRSGAKYWKRIMEILEAKEADGRP